MALTQQERLVQRVEVFHRGLNGHRRHRDWPDARRDEADLSSCATPNAHEFKTQRIELSESDFSYAATYCIKCPLVFLDPVVEADVEGQEKRKPGRPRKQP